MKLMTWNVNGLKPTHKNIELQFGSLETFFNSLGLDIVCFQEAKVNADDVPRSLKHVPGFESFWSFSTTKKGYSGCVTYVRLDHAAHDAGNDSDLPGDADLKSEGRVVITEHRNFVLINVYAPNAGDSLQRPRLEFKMRWFDALRQKITHLTMKGRQVILVGDLNIPRSKADVSFELAWAGLYTDEEVSVINNIATDLVDVWRQLHPDTADTFTVWNERTNARAYNRGLRIDYTMCSQGLRPHVVDCQVKLDLPQKWSDHAPVILELSGITSYDAGPPPPCPNSSRAVPRHGLQALFQRKAVDSLKRSEARVMCGGIAGPGAQDISASPCVINDVAIDKACSKCEPTTDNGHTAKTGTSSGKPFSQTDVSTAAARVHKRRVVEHGTNATDKQRKVTGFFQKRA
eukprot:jgi/Ulvmu1/10574/UM065_0028.1